MASKVFKALNGVVCLYKPLGYGSTRLRKELLAKLCADLNAVPQPFPQNNHVKIRRVALSSSSSSAENEVEDDHHLIKTIPDGPSHEIQITSGPSYSDHPLILGDRYAPQDFRLLGTGPVSPEVSGVHLFGLNGGCHKARLIYHSRWLRTYHISGRFGVSTDTLWHTGRIVEKSTFGAIRPHHLEKLLLSVQSSHQKMAFSASGVPMDSPIAFDLASKGLIRPAISSHPVIYGLKLISLDLPNFIIEVKLINEEYEYLKRLIHEIGLKLHSNAVATKMRCLEVGPFATDKALLAKHWSVDNVISNMDICKEVLKNWNFKERDPLISSYQQEMEDEKGGKGMKENKLISWEDMMRAEEEFEDHKIKGANLKKR